MQINGKNTMFSLQNGPPFEDDEKKEGSKVDEIGKEPTLKFEELKRSESSENFLDRIEVSSRPKQSKSFKICFVEGKANVVC